MSNTHGKMSVLDVHAAVEGNVAIHIVEYRPSLARRALTSTGNKTGFECGNSIDDEGALYNISIIVSNQITMRINSISPSR